MRGLKPTCKKNTTFNDMSHLLQMRGLKHLLTLIFTVFLKVASFTDAWIETSGRDFENGTA